MVRRLLAAAALPIVLMVLHPAGSAAECWKCPAPEDILPCVETDGPGHTGGCGYHPICHGGSCTTYCAGMGSLCNLFGFIDPSGRVSFADGPPPDPENTVFDSSLGVHRRACDGAILSAGAVAQHQVQVERGTQLARIVLEREPRKISVRS